MRCADASKGDPTDFIADGLKSEGHTDYVALVHCSPAIV
jgi:hypothetical protein